MENILVNFVNKIIDLGRPNIHLFDTERQYTDKNLTPILEPEVKALKFSTLKGLVDYIKDGSDACNGYLITIDGHGEVNLRSMMFGPFKQRETYATVTMNVPKITFDTFMDQEAFIISLNAKFAPTADLDLIRRIASTVVDQEEVKLEDDGLAQRVTMKQGITKVGCDSVKPIVELMPFRTFLEVPQPASQFLFRIQKGGRFALFEADGGAWKIEAMNNISDYLHAALKDEVDSSTVVIVM